MSIPVEIDKLADALDAFTVGYLLTADAEGRVKVVSVTPRLRDGTLVCAPSRGSARNLATNPHATVVLPPTSAMGMSLLVDGTGTADDDEIVLVPVSAVLHKSAAS
jgi:hypothetical protein